MAGRGGRRPGAGRKPTAFKRVIHDTPIQAAEKQIASKLPWLVDKLMELAEGVEVQRTLRNGEEKVYTEPPDYRAISYLIDRILGKPALPVEHSGEVDTKVTEVTTIRKALGLAS